MQASSICVKNTMVHKVALHYAAASPIYFLREMRNEHTRFGVADVTREDKNEFGQPDGTAEHNTT